MILMQAIFITRAIGRVGPKIATSKASAIWAQKSQRFQGPPLPMARVMNLPTSKSLSPSAI